jgi:hypothetical protein
MRIHRVVSAVAACAAIAIAFVSAHATPRVLDDPQSGSNGSTLPFALRSAKRALAPDDPRAKVESAVQATTTALARLKDPRLLGTTTDSPVNAGGPGLPVDSDGRMYLRVAGTNLVAHTAELEALGVTIEASVPWAGFLEAWIPAERVLDVAAIADVRLVGVPGAPVYETGSTLTEGDLIHRAQLARTTFSVDGTGARVGVISDGVTSLLASQATLDLPPAVQVGIMGTGDEGTAMLEIVHDLAPGAGLAFHAGGLGSAGLITAMNWLATTGTCRTIVDDLWAIREPYFQDGPVAQNAANLASNLDVAYFTAAGNRATRHIPQPWKDGGARTIGTLGSFRPHDFGGGDVLANVRLRNPGGGGLRHTIVLQWSEPIGASALDFDLYLVNSTQTAVLASSTNLQDGNDDPIEIIDFTWNNADNTPAFLVVDFASAGAPPANGAVTLKIAANGPTMPEWVNPVDSVNPHARGTSVFAVAAIDANDPGNDTAEPSSSQGPATMRIPAVTDREKPDASAVDGVQVTGVGGFTVPFFGTSAAAPHAAAIAALVRGARPDLNASQVLGVVRTTAIDVGPAGWDGPTGTGRVDAFSALASVLNAPPVADAGPDTTVECTGPAGTSVTLNGLRSSDPDGDTITYSWSAPGITFDDPTSATPTGVFPLGSTTVTLVVDDGSLTDDDEVVVTIADTQPPVVSVSLSPDALWPPNHKLATIEATVTALDECEGTLPVRLTSITSNEPDDGLGDGDTADDIQGESIGTADFTFELRSERMGPGDTRVYTVCYEAEDGSGNVGTGCATVTVTHDQTANATFAPARAGADPYAEGGWLDFAMGGVSSAETSGERALELGSPAFTRRVPGGATPTDLLSESTTTGIAPDGSPASVTICRWFVAAADLAALALEAGEPVLYARVESDGVAWLASVVLPPPPAGAAAGTAASSGEVTAATQATAAPLALALRASSPMRAGGSLELTLPSDGPVLARLVTATGRIVGTLARETRSAGTSSLALPRGLSAGIYVVAVDTAQGSARTKIVVLP